MTDAIFAVQGLPYTCFVRDDWGWEHEFGLEEIVADMLENLSREQQLETA